MGLMKQKTAVNSGDKGLALTPLLSIGQLTKSESPVKLGLGATK